MAVLGYLTKLKRYLGLSFGAHDFAWFFYKNVCYFTLSMDKVLVSQLLSQDIKENVLLSSHLDNW